MPLGIVLPPKDVNQQEAVMRQKAAMSRHVTIRATDGHGSIWWYTGCAGPAWISRHRAAAFLGYSLPGAVRKVEQLNRNTAIHGLTFRLDFYGTLPSGREWEIAPDGCGFAVWYAGCEHGGNFGTYAEAYEEVASAAIDEIADSQRA